MFATLIASVLSGEASEVVGRTRRAALAYLLAGLLAIVGIGFLVGAGYIALSREVGEIEAAVWIGGGAILLAIVIVGVHRIVAAIQARRAARRRKTEVRALASAAAMAAIPTLLASRGRGILLLAPAAAALAYAIWSENKPSSREPRDPLD